MPEDLELDPQTLIRVLKLDPDATYLFIIQDDCVSRKWCSTLSIALGEKGIKGALLGVKDINAIKVYGPMETSKV